MLEFPLGPYEPDRGPFNANVVPIVDNLCPTADGWGPLPAIVPTPTVYAYLTWDASGDKIQWENGDNIIVALDYGGIVGVLKLPAECIGFFAARKRNGSEVLFAGTATKLYRFNQTSFTWEDVSSTTYAAACRWSFAKWGDKVYCQNGNDIEQKFDIESDSVFSNNASAPICKYLLVVGNFLFRLHIVAWAAEPSFVSPAAVMCCALEDPEDNTLQDYNWCDAQFVPLGDEITGGIAVTGGAHIWLTGGVVPLTVPMANGITFQLGDVDTTRGCSAPYSIGSFGRDRYIVYTDDGFWLFDGGFSPIGQDRINATFLRSVDQSTFEDILSMNDPEHAIIWISYTNTDGERRLFGYQYNLNRFTAADIAIAASFVCRTFVYTESDPPITVANQPRFTIIDQDGQLGYLVGDAMAARIKTNQIQASDGRTIIDRWQLNGDPQPGDFTLTPSTRDVKGGTPRQRTARTASQRSGDVASRANGRTHEIQIDLAAGADWKNISSVSAPGGKRAGRA